MCVLHPGDARREISEWRFDFFIARLREQRGHEVTPLTLRRCDVLIRHSVDHRVSDGSATTVNSGAAGESPILIVRTVTIQICPTPRSFKVSTALTCSVRASSTIQIARWTSRCEK